MADGRIDVGVLGATGMVGQRLVERLNRHPWFRLAWLAASDRTAGRRYREVPWRIAGTQPDGASNLVVESCTPGAAPQLVFSALDAEAAGEIEPAFARAGHVVISNARTHRMEPDVPLLIPEINPDHLSLLDRQRAARGWPGLIVTNPNCSTIFLAMALAPLRRFDVDRVIVTTEQALSGAGYPGVASLDAVANVIPYIAGEEEKIETETLRILGCLRSDGAAGQPGDQAHRLSVEPYRAVISAQATRVPVVDGHTGAVSVGCRGRATEADLLEAWRSFRGPEEVCALPSAPARPVHYLGAPDRPQPRLDVEAGDGMVVSIGRLRACPVLGFKFVFLGHNTVRGAAGAAILNGELLKARGYVT